MSESYTTYELTEQELFFLGRMLEVSVIFGMRDPFKGYLIDEIKENYNRVVVRLIEKQYLSRDEAGKLQVDPVLGACLLACGGHYGLQLGKAVPDQPVYQANLYMTPHLVAELTASASGEGFVLRPLANVKRVMQELASFFPPYRYDYSFQAVQVHGYSWEQWLALSEEEQIGKLRDKGCSETESVLMAEAFHYPDMQGSMRKWMREGLAWRLAGIHYVSDRGRVYCVSDVAGGSLLIEPYQPEIPLSFLSFLEDRVMSEDTEEPHEELTEAEE